MRCDECNKPSSGLVRCQVAGEEKTRDLCGECFERLHPERCKNVDQEAINKRVMEKLWLRMVDLPGYAEWSAQYRGLDTIIWKLDEHHVLVHPDEFGRPLDKRFEREFQDWLDDLADRGAHRRTLKDYMNT